MGKISLEGIKLQAPIGVHEEERLIKRDFLVDVVAEVDFEDQALQDKIDNTVDYEIIYSIVTDVMKQPCNLMETAAARIGEEVSLRLPKIRNLKIRITKSNPFLTGKVLQSSIEWEKKIS
jgi:7,8-dihydroneopterin aldolase/epimerase/oxygenase